ncbi:DNA-binding SARP family transcriptional activator/predicted negative regulator of RcsB-dependent stress response [Arthrobacter globiformis]|uniref:SARP family transcriptional regulator n=1 Tax=Arthrobacter globiformis TaxID=1665 RepID=UPI002784952B|nr:SARP family transcriptional regulator [Arthrobacter globiformis]MDQ1057432.1 DNA-binding SARP family transcriptional activator/predicted negative regulator of RcsB-dependent stress response [Arthrobacter globiformis]
MDPAPRSAADRVPWRKSCTAPWPQGLGRAGLPCAAGCGYRTVQDRLAAVPDAADPLGALRWNLSELRRTLDGVRMAGDPLRLEMQPAWRCDAVEAVASPGSSGLDPRRLDGQLLEGLSFADCPMFDSWVADQRYRLDNCVLSLLYEAALAALAADEPAEAVELATLALHRDTFHADCNAVLVKALVALGEHQRARDHVAKCADLYRQELGLPLPAEIRRALSTAAPAEPGVPATSATVRSYLDAGGASLLAGAVDRGLDQLRLAVVLAQRSTDRHLIAESLVTLSGALIHQAGGRGAEVADFLHRALSAEGPDGASRTSAAAYRELGYLSVQRGVPDRAAGWLGRAMLAAEGFPDEQARILGIQGMLASDTAHYEDAVVALTASGRLAKAAKNRRQQAFSRALLGRVQLLQGDAEAAATSLDRALEWVAAEHWTAFEPFVSGLRGETYLAAGRLEEAAELIDRSWVLADLAGDHCYMALAAGAEARLFLAHGDLAAAQHWVERGLEPKPWYLWYSARLLDVAVEVAIAAGSPRASEFVGKLDELASRSGMREFVVRARSHRALLGDEAAAQTVPWLANEIDSRALKAFLAERGTPAS